MGLRELLSRSAEQANGFTTRAKNYSSEGLSVKSYITGAVAALALLGAGVYTTCTKYVAPDEFGIMQVDMNLGGLLGKTGIQEREYTTGTYLEIPTFQKMHILPKNVQVLTLKAQSTPDGKTANDDGKTSRYVRQINPVHIQTSDGFYIDVDVSILYHIKRPYKTMTVVGGGRLFEDNGLIPIAEPTLKEVMGTLTPEDFYDTHKRVEKQAESKAKLNIALEPKGMEVDEVLVRYPNFHPKIQEKIEGKNLQEQAELLNMTKASEAAAKADLTKIVEEGKANIEIKLNAGKNYVALKNAAMKSYKTIKESDADTLTNTANSKRTELINEAYQGTGSERVVAMEMAEVLKGLDYILVTTGGDKGFNPLDLEAMSRAFQIQSKATTEAPK